MINASPICVGCVQNPRGERRIETDGLGTSGILVVGDSPWIDEIRYGRPFAGAAGFFLDRIFRRLGHTRNEFLITNALWCKPPHLGWSDHPEKFMEAALALNHCRPHLDGIIERFRPRAIVTLGNAALQRVLGVSGLDARHSYVCNSPYGIPVIPTYHPSFVMQGKQKFEAAVFFAFRRAVEVAEGKFKRSPTVYALDDADEVRAYLETPITWLERNGMASDGIAMHTSPGDPLIEIPTYGCLSVDIETPESSKLDEEAYDEESVSYTIVRAGFSHTTGTACSFPWAEPFIGMARRALKRANVTLMWNQNFDDPRLRAAGMEYGEIHDGMWAWHFLQSDLPKGLGFVAPFYCDFEPWKHLNQAQPAFYNATDNDAALRSYLGVQSALLHQGRWERWLRHCVRALPRLQRMGRAGLRVDPIAQATLKESLDREAEAAFKRVQEEVPRSVKKRKRYKKQPKDYPSPDYDTTTIVCPDCDGASSGQNVASSLRPNEILTVLGDD